MNVAGLHWNHKLLILRVNLFISLPSHNSVQTYSTAGWNSKSLQKWYRYVRKTKLYKTVMTKWAFFRKLWRTTRTTDVAERPTVKSPWQFLREFTTCAERCANEYRSTYIKVQNKLNSPLVPCSSFVCTTGLASPTKKSCLSKN